MSCFVWSTAQNTKLINLLKNITKNSSKFSHLGTWNYCVKSTESKPKVLQNCTKVQYLSKCTGGYFPPVASSPCGISQNHLFREQLASRLSQVFSYQDFIWMGQPSSHDVTSMLWLYNAHCLPRTLHYT